MSVFIPPYLKTGDTIAITCPAGYMPAENAAVCIDVLKQQGYKVITGKTLGSNSENYFSGTDEERLKDLQTFLDDKNVDAILFGRGGYGTSRIIDKLCFKKFLKHPKWVMGFSDITVLHTYLYSNHKIASLHTSMAAAFNDGGHSEVFIAGMLAAMKGEKGKYEVPSHTLNRVGHAKGNLIGGNLSLLVNGIGTSSDIKTKNCILFIEDLAEQLYHIDRMMIQLKRSGKLKNLAGLVVGGFTEMKDTERPFGKNVYELIADAVAEYDYPVCFQFPVSHGKENVALKQGVKYKLNVKEQGSLLEEL